MAAPIDSDPTVTNPDLYRVIFENDRVRVLAYEDQPGDRTRPHLHPDSVMYTLSGFRRRLHASDGTHRDVELSPDVVGWLPAQEHAGENIGDTATRVVFVELKAPVDLDAEGIVGPAAVGPIVG